MLVFLPRTRLLLLFEHVRKKVLLPVMGGVYIVSTLPTCPSFCMSVHRSSTSVQHWVAACTHACAYCPATELRRSRGAPGEDKKNPSWPQNTKQPTWRYNNRIKKCYLSKCTLFPRLAHQQVEGWWRSLCLQRPQLKPGAGWSPLGSPNTLAQGHAVLELCL